MNRILRRLDYSDLCTWAVPEAGSILRQARAECPMAEEVYCYADVRNDCVVVVARFPTFLPIPGCR